MAGSLFDQLKKSGLVNDKKAKQLQREKQQQAKQKNANKAKKGERQQNDATLLAAKAAEEKAQRDRELNQQRQQQQAEKAKKAELKQIIESNQLKGYEGDITYNFADDSSVKTLNVNAATQKGLSNDQIHIVRFNNGYTLVKAELLDKIEQRDASVIVRNQNLETKLSKEDEEYYSKFAIPDDLVW
ncbi:DUF2058 domain-containing protein [Thiomicrorhabdus heinhorstiae]|uniref:DUF2058 domain-containing protein n=1 Tax=Thiomicrorhabdus heinhorstiae TaxID=2748010 RepID=A0ABS0C063_9GAMM|nr:DUF2058 domain-containing protein [Thiomicrorhabdus heinhorstiae]MBF6058476.1 DUF2058 domain-containing protein [Thiomicrorhabdus heinhorstiae]